MTDTVSEILPFFRPGKWYRLPGRWWAVTTTLDRERDAAGIAELMKSKVIIGDKVYRCTGIERFMHAAPWRAGEEIGLLVDGDENGPIEAK